VAHSSLVLVQSHDILYKVSRDILYTPARAQQAPDDAQGLEHATPAGLSTIEITPSGLGIHFPKLDADLYLPALLEGFLGSQKWMAARLGAAGGKSKSAAKRSAARANGALGGRPRIKKTSAR